jgi:hypothetical protein
LSGSVWKRTQKWGEEYREAEEKERRTAEKVEMHQGIVGGEAQEARRRGWQWLDAWFIYRVSWVYRLQYNVDKKSNYSIPGIKSLEMTSLNLPVLLTSFIGHEQEIAVVKSMLSNAHHPRQPSR